MTSPPSHGQTGLPAGRRRPASNIGRILAVGSGKGGVGKSTVTVNVALALAAAGRRVGVLDADVYGPNVPLLLGIRQRQPLRGGALAPVAGALANGERPRPVVRFGLAVLSLAFFVGEDQHLLPGNQGFVGPLIRRLLFDAAWGPLDYLLLDLPPGTGEPQATLAREVDLDGVVLVVTPQDLSLLDTARALSMFREAETAIVGVVENMSFFVCPHCGERIEVFDRPSEAWAARDAGGPLLGEVPLDLAISRAANAGEPVVVADPDSPGAAAFHAIAAEIERRLDAWQTPPRVVP